MFEKIKALCKLKGISITKLERETKNGNGTIRKWEKVCPSAEKLSRVADYFNVSVDFILDRPCASNLSEAGKTVATEFDTLTDEKRELVLKYISVLKAS